MKDLLRHLCSSTLITALIISNSVQYTSGQLQTCSQIFASSAEENAKMLLCQLYESSSLLAQLGIFISKDIEKLLANEGVTTDEVQDIEKGNMNICDSARESMSTCVSGKGSMNT
ncbi:BMA-FLP-14 [Dirofilaria immitis]|nr:BMA-FLP-14 [Dirofilaria immitis]